jgi:universal stress protein E
MTEFNKILIVLDVYNDFRDNPDHQPKEIEKALALLGERTDAELFLIGCGFEEFLHDSYSNFGPDALEQRKKFVKEMEHRLQVFGDALAAKGFKVDCRVHWTYPRYEQIAKEAQELDVDLVIQHVHTQKSFEQHNLSHDTWQLIRTCNKPLLLIKQFEWPAAPLVLAAVDPVHSHHKPLRLDNIILNLAEEAAEKLHGKLHLVHAYSESARPFSKEGAILQSHQQAITELLSDYSIPASNLHMVDDTPANAILHTRDTLQADIVVLGALSRSRLSEAIIGNTADRVLDYVKSDLFIVKPRS